MPRACGGEPFNDGNGSTTEEQVRCRYFQFRLVGDDGYSQ